MMLIVDNRRFNDNSTLRDDDDVILHSNTFKI